MIRYDAPDSHDVAESTGVAALRSCEPLFEESYKWTVEETKIGRKHSPAHCSEEETMVVSDGKTHVTSDMDGKPSRDSH